MDDIFKIERQFLCCCMIDQDFQFKIDNIPTIHTYFGDERNKDIFNAIMQLRESDIEADITTLPNILKEKVHISYLMDVYNEVSTSANINHFLKGVFSLYMGRKLNNMIQYTINQLGAEKCPLEAFKELQENCALLDDKQSTIKTYSLAESCIDAYTQMSACIDNDTAIMGIRTGFNLKDETIHGYEPGKFYILAARPSMGKSTKMQNEAVNMAKSGKSVLIISLEMVKEEFAKRIIQEEGEVSLNYITEGNKGELYERIAIGLDSAVKLPIKICEEPTMTIDDIVLLTKKEHKRGNVDIVYVDHIGLTDVSKYENEFQGISDASKKLKRLSKTLSIPVVALSQLNRKADGIRPTLAHLALSGSIEADADMVSFLFNKDFADSSIPAHEKETLEIIAKNRGGACRDISLQFTAHHYSFKENF